MERYGCARVFVIILWLSGEAEEEFLNAPSSLSWKRANKFEVLFVLTRAVAVRPQTMGY